MKLFLNFFSTFSLLFLFVATVFAHEAEVPHEEPVPTVSPLLLVGIVAILAIGGLILWKFVLRNPHSPSSSTKPSESAQTQEKTVSQSVESEVSSQNK